MLYYLGTSSVPSFVPDRLSPFPNVTDYAFAPITVAGFVTPFLQNCPYDVAAILPVVETVIPVAAPNSSLAPNPTQAQLNGLPPSPLLPCHFSTSSFSPWF